MGIKRRKFGIGSKIFIVVSALVLIALLSQAWILRSMVQKEIKKNAIELLSRETNSKVNLIADIVLQIRADIAIMQAHKAIEDYFTFLAFEDADGMTEAVSTIEPFFSRIYNAKPRYTKMQLMTIQGSGILQLVNGARVETFDQYDNATALEKLKKLDASENKILHYAIKDKKDGWVILSVGALIIEGKIEGLLWLHQSINGKLESMLADLQQSNISCVISDLNGKTIIHSQNINNNTISGFIQNKLSGWLIDAKKTPYLHWNIHLGLLKKIAYQVLTQITTAGVIVLIVSLIVVTGLLWFVVRSITKPVNQIISGLNEGSDQVASASVQISSASQSLAEGSSEQAASIEETSSSLEEMSSMTKQNADNAGQADNLMKEANQVVGKANESMTELTTSMEEISKASEETSKIIKTIDEIAFQTNLLALNAAVEAARAGEAGAGFAVVADEVRNLAMRAAEAARSTADLIEGTVKKISEGGELVGATNEAFTQVAESSSKVGDLVAEISAASSEQAEGVEQVNKAVTEMDKVVQKNAANSEESAAASEEMNAQAEQMKGFVNDLVMIVGGGGKKGAQNVSYAKAMAPKAVTTTGALAAPVQKEVRPEQVIPMDDDDFQDF